MIPDLTDSLTSPFWLAAASHELAICTCKKCNLDIWYPKLTCPKCGKKPIWRKLSGKAHLLSWTTSDANINSLFLDFYLPAIVIPVDAPTVHLVTQIILDNSFQKPTCDMALQVDFRILRLKDNEDFIAPVFVPA